MSLFGSLNSGVSALFAQSQAMSLISDNIANVNTVGYKSARPKFKTLVTQSNNEVDFRPGGVDTTPFYDMNRQGLLESSASKTDIAVSGSGFFVVNTISNPSVTDPFLYTRSGSFNLDSSGNLRNAAGYYLQGYALDSDGNIPTGTATDQLSSLETVNTSGLGSTSRPTRNVTLGLNLPTYMKTPVIPGAELAGEIYSVNTNITTYDTLGSDHNLTIKWEHVNNGLQSNNATLGHAWRARIWATGDPNHYEQPHSSTTPATWTYSLDGETTATTIEILDDNGTVVVTFAAGALAAGAQTFTWAAPPAGDVAPPAGFADGNYTIRVSGQNGVVNVNTVNGTPQEIVVDTDSSGTLRSVHWGGFPSAGDPNLPTFPLVLGNTDVTGALQVPLVFDFSSNGAEATHSMTLDFGNVNSTTGVTAFDDDYAVSFINQNGVQPSDLGDLSIGDDGIVTANFKNGETKDIYQLPLAIFPNQNGLEAQSGNTYQQTVDSGDLILTTPNNGGAGSIAPSSLEGSTVDLADEFTALIVTQRSYSAATKVITTADTMLDEVIRLKR